MATHERADIVPVVNNEIQRDTLLSDAEAYPLLLREVAYNMELLQIDPKLCDVSFLECFDAQIKMTPLRMASDLTNLTNIKTFDPRL